MSLREIANAIGVGEYTPALDEAYAAMRFTEEPAVDIGQIDSLQKEWNLFGDYYELVRAIGIQINADEVRAKWVKFSAKYVLEHDATDAKKVPAPAFDGTVITNMLPLYTHLPSIPVGIADYLSRGFTREQVESLMSCYKSALSIVKHRTGLPGLNKTYYNWDINFTKCRIFKAEGLQFELRTIPDAVIYLKNKLSGQVLAVRESGIVHRTGIQMLGSEGYEDEEGAFEVSFREDEQAFYGHGVFDSRVDLEERAFQKSQWEVYLRPGDDCLSVHIPSGTDISKEAVERYISVAREMVRKHFPEHKGTSIFGSSWILDPKLQEFTGPNSKITAFQKMFVTYPQKVDGNGVFMFVFDGKPKDLNDLEENTSLQRKLKKLYLEGGHILPYAGIIVE